jgi:hypothetical protein
MRYEELPEGGIILASIADSYVGQSPSNDEDLKIHIKMNEAMITNFV